MSALDRRRVEELAQALEPRARSIVGEHRVESAPVALARRLRDAGTTLEAMSAPQPEFRAALRARLVAVATVQPVNAASAPSPSGAAALARRWRSTRVQQGATVAAGAVACVVAVSGVAVASSQALPGDPFYDVKRTAEGVQLRLADGNAAEGRRHLQFAATRLDELAAMAVGGEGDRDVDLDWDRVRETLSDMDDETRAGSRLLERAWRDSGDRSALDVLSSFTADQAAGLQALLPALAPRAIDEARASLALVGQLAGTTQQLLGVAPCGPGCTRGTAPGGGSVTDPSCDCPSPAPAVPRIGKPSLPPTLPVAPPAGSPESSPATTSTDGSTAPPGSTEPSAPPPSDGGPAPALSPLPGAPPATAPSPSAPSPSAPPPPSPLPTPLSPPAVTTPSPLLDPALPSL
jgi:hypothetical protein